MLSQDKIDKWLETISQDKQFQKDQKHDVWKDNIKRYTGRFHRPMVLEDREFVDVNFVYAYIKTVMPAVYFKDPYIFIQSRGEEDIEKANVIEAIINYVWKEVNLKEEVKRVILDTLLFGVGWMKIGYTAEFGRTIENSLQGQATDRKTPEGKVIEFNEFIKEENVFGTRISPFNVFVPRGYHRFVDMPYIIEERLEDIDAVKNNKSYKNTSELVPTHKLDTGFQAIKAPNMLASPTNKMAGSDNRDNVNKVMLWEVWDKREQKVYTFGKGVKKALQERDWDLDIEGFPYIPLKFNTVPNNDEQSHFYPISDIEPLIPQLTEQSRLRTSMVKHRKKFMRKYIVEKGAMDQDQMDVLKEPETGLIAEVNDITKITPTADVTVPSDLYRINDVIKNDLMEISGVNQLMLGGGSAPGVNTATEANMVAQGASLRVTEKQDQVEDFTRDAARKLIQIMRQFVDREFRLRTMIEGKDVDITGTREDLQAEVDVKIEAGSTQPPTDTAIERKQLIDLAIGVLQQPLFQRFVNPRILLQKIAKTFPALKDSKIFTGGAEDEQIIAQQENQLLQQGMIQLVHPSDDHELHLKVHSILAQNPNPQSPQEQQILPIVAQHINSHNEFIGERMGKGRSEALTPKNITEQGAIRPADANSLGQEGAGGVGTSP